MLYYQIAQDSSRRIKLLAIKLHIYYYMPTNNILEIITLTLILTITNQQCCQKFSQQLCVQCPQGMHLYRSNCIYDLPNCIEYQDGFDCSRCRQGWQLLSGRCTHPRYNLEISKLSNFTPFLQSGVKPDLLFQQAKKQLAADNQLWIDWYNYTALKNRTIISSSTLKRQAMEVQATLLGSAGSKVHFVCTAKYSVNNIQLTIYRLTYILADNRGYADLYFLVEGEDNALGYLQVCGVDFQLLEGPLWQGLAKEYEAIFGQVLSRYFLVINQEELLKGYWRYVNEVYNITMFYLDRDVGVVSYIYVGTASDLAQIGIVSISNSNNAIIHSNISQNSTASEPTNQKTDDPFSNGSALNNQTSTSTKSNQTQMLPKASTEPSQPIANSSETQQSNLNQNKPTTQQNNTEQRVALSELSINPIYVVGQAVAVQYGFISSDSEVIALSFFPNNNSRALYFVQAKETQPIYSKIIFLIDVQANQFSLVSFVQSTKNICVWLQPSFTEQKIDSTNSSNVRNRSNSSSDQTSNSTNQNSDFGNQNTNSNKQPSPTVNPTPSPTINPTPSPTINPTPSPAINTSALPKNNQGPTICPQLNKYQAIDITNQTGSDIFLPKINLLLISMYAQDLQNCAIVGAKYTWILNSQVLVKTIRYNITYGCKNGTKYLFVAEISNNQLRFISKPEGIRQQGTYNQQSNQTNLTSPSTPQLNNKNNTNNTNTSTNVKGSSSQNKNNAQNIDKQNSSQTINNEPIMNQNQNNHNQPKTTSDSLNNSTPIPNIPNHTQPNSIQPTVPHSTQAGIPTPPSPPMPTPPTPNSRPPRPSDLFTGPNIPSPNQNASPNSSSSNISERVNGGEQIKKNLIPESSFKSDPRYKSIIEIVKSIKRLPPNVTVCEMYTWSTPQKFQYFTILFQMPFKQTLEYGSVKKRFYFQVEVNPSSYVTITNSTISFQKGTSPEQKSILSSSYNPSTSGKSQSKASLLNASPYSEQLIKILLVQGAALSKFKGSVLSIVKISEDFQGMVSNYNQIVQFQGIPGRYCYSIAYRVISLPTAWSSCKDFVQLIKYELVNCTQQDSNVFASLSVNTDFRPVPQNIPIRDRIKSFTPGNTTFYQYSQIGTKCKVKYSTQGVNHTIIIDTQNMLVLLYEVLVKVVYTPISADILSKQEQSLLQKQVQKQLGIINGTFQIFYITMMTTCQSSVWLLDVYVLQTNRIEWGIELEIGLKIKLIYNQNQLKATTVSRSIIDLPSNPGYFTNYYGMNSYLNFQWQKLLSSAQFPYIMASLQTIYPSFLQACKILAFLAPSQQSLSEFFNKTINKYLTLKMIILKQFTKSYYANYVITIDYNPLNMDVKVKAVQALPTIAIQLRYCDSVSIQNGLAICSKCANGYTLSDGRCWKDIDGCEYMFRGMCLSCKEGHGNSDLKVCRQKNQLEQAYLNLINLSQLGSKKG